MTKKPGCIAWLVSLFWKQQQEEKVTQLPEAVSQAFQHLCAYEDVLLQQTKNNLDARVAGRWAGDDDAIFVDYTFYLLCARVTNIVGRATAVWEEHLAQEVRAAEAELQKADPNARIHKGAPYFNVGVNHFLLGNFDQFFQYLLEAGEEDYLSGRGPASRIITDNQLSDEVLHAPLVAWLSVNSPGDHKSLTDQDLTLDEYKNLLRWLATTSTADPTASFSDTLQLVLALNRAKKAVMTPVMNMASEHLFVQALADLVLILESSMRHWQVGVAGGTMLHARFEQHFVVPYPDMKTAFESARDAFNTQHPSKEDRVSTAAVDWIVNHVLAVLGNPSSNRATQIGATSVLAVKLRNALLHAVHSELQFVKDPAKRIRVLGLMVCVLQACRAESEGTLSGLL